MKRIVPVAALVASLIGVNGALAGGGRVQDVAIKFADGKPVDWAAFKGKAMLIVNIATQCGYTPQLDGLQKLSEKYGPKGLVVLGVPSNDFGGQTPEAGGEVPKFCKLHYGVTFPITEKVVVKGAGKHALANTLLAGSASHAEIGWNFEKFVLDRSGNVVARFGSGTKPESRELLAAIEKALKK